MSNCKDFGADMMRTEHSACTGVIHSWKKRVFSCEKELVNIHQLNACLYFSFHRHKMNGGPLYAPAEAGSVETTKNLLTPTKFFWQITFWTSLAFATFSLFCCNIFSIAWRPLSIVSAFLFRTYWGELCKISKLTCHSKEKTIGEITKICLFLCTISPKIFKFFLCFSWWVT